MTVVCPKNMRKDGKSFFKELTNRMACFPDYEQFAWDKSKNAGNFDGWIALKARNVLDKVI